MAERSVEHVWQASPRTGEALLFHLALARHAVPDRLDPDYDEQIWEASLPAIADDARIPLESAEAYLEEFLHRGLVYRVQSNYPEHVVGDQPSVVYALRLPPYE